MVVTAELAASVLARMMGNGDGDGRMRRNGEAEGKLADEADAEGEVQGKIVLLRSVRASARPVADDSVGSREAWRPKGLE